MTLFDYMAGNLKFCLLYAKLNHQLIEYRFIRLNIYYPIIPLKFIVIPIKSRKIFNFALIIKKTFFAIKIKFRKLNTNK